ncbi:BZ3500_MvSof-1268-A1-R1_Chr5-2g07928 [Microbotryum saponariae]|uniref:BZ3500_MvSof-1268-A1-R1_Chr5-2g07928 protein n=1 Tax=Microbotryum saponariae TaxID=289078 RepID=A0A2X0NK35_9BASI|nr:BZ3500_MvSof-1268-A1-R1_Chr5-2g07928 [Microbotryum saponariae]SDA05797.1 BZ3501_MvSof-1269-A2-R1_Chr5-2g07750 [Microbotryum saponariae]
MQLTHVCYWGPGSSAAFLAPCLKYNWILRSFFKLQCPIANFVVAMLYRLLLLVGLDYSTRSLSSSIETRKRDQKNRILRALHRDLGYSPTAPSSPIDQPAFNTASAPFRIYERDSDDGSDHISTYALSADLKVATEAKWNNELMYSRVMRRTHASLRLLGQGLHGLRILGRELTSEARMIARTIRRMVVFFLGGLMITAETGAYTRSQVGLDRGLPFDPNGGSRPDEIRRHSKAKIHETRQQMLHESLAGLDVPDLTKAPSSSGGKRVSFSQPSGQYAWDLDVPQPIPTGIITEATSFVTPEEASSSLPSDSDWPDFGARRLARVAEDQLDQSMREESPGFQSTQGQISSPKAIEKASTPEMHAVRHPAEPSDAAQAALPSSRSTGVTVVDQGDLGVRMGPGPFPHSPFEIEDEPSVMKEASFSKTGRLLTSHDPVTAPSRSCQALRSRVASESMQPQTSATGMTRTASRSPEFTHQLALFGGATMVHESTGSYSSQGSPISPSQPWPTLRRASETILVESGHEGIKPGTPVLEDAPFEVSFAAAAQESENLARRTSPDTKGKKKKKSKASHKLV